MYTVTRQVQYPEGLEIVEVSMGSFDYANPDMLVAKHPGEGESFYDPIEAAEVGMEICRRWRKDSKKRIRVGYGATLGNTIPFEPCTFKELRAWAKERHESLLRNTPSCDTCGEILWDPKTRWRGLFNDDTEYCSEICVEKAYEAAECPEFE